MRKISFPEISAILTFSALMMFLTRYVHTRGFLSFIYKETLFFLIIPIIFLLVRRKDLREYGFSIEKKNKIIKYFVLVFLIGIPFMLIGSGMEDFQAYYPRFSYGNWIDFIKMEMAIGLLMLATEFFFRGFLLFGMKDLGRLSILIQTIPYTYIHIGKPIFEVYYSFFAGIALGYIDWESKSILPSFILHWTTSIVFDLLCIYQTIH